MNTVMKITLILIITISQSAAEKDTVPVFVIDFEKLLTVHIIMTNPFVKIPAENFSAVVENAQKNSKRIVVFIDSTLTTEDLSLRDSRGIDFPNLQTVLNKGYVTYYPAVINAYATLKRAMQPSYHNTFFLGNPEKQLKDMDKKLPYLYMFFNPKHNLSRIDLLREHDYKIMATYKLLRQMSSGPIIGFYTAKRNPIDLNEMNVYRRTEKTHRTSSYVMIVSGGAMFRFSGVYIIANTHYAPYDKKPTVSRETRSDKSLESVLSYNDFEFKFKFSFQDRGWKLDSVALLEGGEEVGSKDILLGAPWNASFMCSEPLVIINNRDGSVVTISKYQIEPLAPHKVAGGGGGGGGGTSGGGSGEERSGGQSGSSGSGGNGGTSYEGRSRLRGGSEEKFSDPVHCGPYFSIAIISGLFVGAVCLTGLLGALALMLQCKTNPRYEDTNTSKYLTIIEN